MVAGHSPWRPSKPSTTAPPAERSPYGNFSSLSMANAVAALLVLLHIFRKTTAKLPTSEILIAQARWQDFQARMNTTPRRPPRAAGHDAP